MHSVLQDVASEIMKEMQAKPDLIIGNYSDGNLVATLLAHKLGVTQVCLIVHELSCKFLSFPNVYGFVLCIFAVYHCPRLGENQIPELRYILGQIRQSVSLLMPVHS
jgi:hypothetical protein